MNKIGTRLAAGALCFVFLASILGMSGGTSADPEKIGENKKAEITVESGSTTAFGGGNYTYLKFGTDAYFGVLWGNDSNPNSITMLVIQSRYLGNADVYDTNGAKIANNFPIKVYTVYGMKLLDMFEFNDINGDGVCNGIHVGDGLSYKDYIVHEPIYKGVSFSTAWKQSNISETNTNDSKVYSFSLTATNLSYKAIGISKRIQSDVTNKTLDKVQFTYHLTASLVNVDNVAVPHYKITVDDNGKHGLKNYEVVNSGRLADQNYSGERGSYTVKWDTLIHGWAFDSSNINKSLLLEWRALAAYYIPEKVSDWLNIQFMTKTGGEGLANYTDANGTIRKATSSDNPLQPPQKLKRDSFINFGGNWTEMGRVTWSSNCTVDNEPRTMYAQVQGGKAISITGEAGNILVGFAVLGGFSYPGGQTIIHDPGIDGAVLIDMQPGPAHFPLGIVLVSGLIVAAVVVVALAINMGGSKKKASDEYQYDNIDKVRNGENWQDYYNRK